jgi:hypothetical protein
VKGDFSRSTFNPTGHYTQLPLQQGRVLVDADWNEQAEIALYDARATRRAVIGASGGPLDGAALRLEIGLFSPGEPALGVGGVTADPFGSVPFEYVRPGRYWVEGSTLTQEHAWPLNAQPHLSEPLPTVPGFYLAWVDVFERLLTALDRPEIREKAMGGPDHGTRVQQIWQVRLAPIPAPASGDPDCFDVPTGWRPPTPTGRLHARTADPVTSVDPCVVPRTAGYRRLENQLYRVEIRDGGTEASAGFVWSRDNGIVRVRAYKLQGAYPSIEVAELGRDEQTRLATDDWVEITDEARTLAGLPGYLCQISRVSGTTLELDAASAPSEPEFDALMAPTVRRWDRVDESKHIGATYLGRVDYPVSATFARPGEYFDLEDGVQIRFAPGTYRTGDYWLIPARTTSGDVEFPDDPQLPLGVPHQAAALGILQRDVAGVWRVVRDCRNLFPPLTRLAQLHYVGGDGQEALPGALLPGALEVVARNGMAPVAGIDVVFAVRVPAGTADTPASREARGYLLDGAATSPSSANGRFTLTATTNALGIASVRWVLGALDIQSSSGWSQHVTATVDRHGPADPVGELHFHANQSIARQVQVDIGACPANEDPLDDRDLATVEQLMGVAGLDPANPAHQNVQHVLHQLLCRLHAGHVPYKFPAVPAEVVPASASEVKAALDALYWLVLQRQGGCCLTDAIQKLAQLIGGKAGSALCEALQKGPVDGECSLLDITLGAALNLVRVVYGVALAFLDLGDAPGPGRGYADLKLGDETGIELEAFIQGEGPGWFASRVEERLDQAEALGDRLLDLVLATLERVFEARGIADALQELGRSYGRPDATWNGPATRRFILDRIWEPLFRTRRLDDVALVALRELLLEIVRQLWKAFVELLLCGEPVPERIPTPTWLKELDAHLGRALERATSLHGLVRELPEDQFGTAVDVHMVAPSEAYLSGATWVVTDASDASGNARPHLLRWRHTDDGAGPLPALDNERLPENLVLPLPDFVISIEPEEQSSVRVLDSGARRQSLHLLLQMDRGDGPVLPVLWWLPSAEVSPVEGEYSERFPGGLPKLGTAYSHQRMTEAVNLLASGGPDDPPTVVGWLLSRVRGLHVWPATQRDEPYVVGIAALAEVGVPSDPPLDPLAFTIDAKEGTPGRFVAVALTRYDELEGTSTRRNVLLLLEGRGRDGGVVVPWWTADELAIRLARDLPPGVSVVGGAHDVVALQHDGSVVPGDTDDDGSGGPRWALLKVEDLLGNTFPVKPLVWNGELRSVAIVEIPDEHWHEGSIASVVHGSDGPWVQALGPLSGRVGLYAAWKKQTALQRQMVRGAAVGEAAISQAKAIFDTQADAPADGQSIGADVRVAHDYMLEDERLGMRTRRLLTVCLRSSSGGDTPVIEFNTSPGS